MLDWTITLLRLIQLSSGAVLFGVPLFSLYGPKQVIASVTRIIWIMLGGMVLANALTVVVQTSSLTSTSPAAVLFTDLSWYITETRIGRVNGMRLIGLLAYTVLFAAASPSTVRSTMQALLGGGILGSFAMTGHGAENSWHTLFYLAHILMAGVWVGALVSLCALLANASRNRQLVPAAVQGLNAFSSVGVVVVALLVASGVSNALLMFGISDPAALYRSEYGQILLLKLALLATMVVLAAANRYWLAPLLEQSARTGKTADALRFLRRSIFTETAIAIIVLGFAAQLASTDPPGI